jgi:hypothetical protein
MVITILLCVVVRGFDLCVLCLRVKKEISRRKKKRERKEEGEKRRQDKVLENTRITNIRK